jgi:hypothetical protein
VYPSENIPITANKPGVTGYPQHRKGRANSGSRNRSTTTPTTVNSPQATSANCV